MHGAEAGPWGLWAAPLISKQERLGWWTGFGEAESHELVSCSWKSVPKLQPCSLAPLFWEDSENQPTFGIGKMLSPFV